MSLQLWKEAERKKGMAGKMKWQLWKEAEKRQRTRDPSVISGALLEGVAEGVKIKNNETR
jgi:predicted RNA-binding protein